MIYRARYIKNKFANVLKFSKSKVWFIADGKRFVYSANKFQLDFVKGE